MVATFVENSRSVLDTLASLEHFLDLSVRLELLEFLIRVKVRVLVVQANDVAQMHQVWLHVIHEAAGVHIASNRPVSRVHDVPRLEVLVVGVDLPDFLQPKAVVLHAHRIFVELESRLEALGKVTAGALAEDGLFRHDFHASHVVVFLAAIFSDAECVCDDTLDLAFFFNH
uniref:Uncharacterized protein n=1 Tax=Favella ehrenbergii TaxID=182087 RepID=A0A7S3MMD6_9SPIT